jgi:hypothetical protein
VKVRTTDNVTVFGIAKTSLSEIKPGSYIGVTGMPEPDGTQKAVAVHIFPENQRGVAEGFRPWDLRPNSTMTNATVAETVGATDGQIILVKYKDGEKKVLVTPETPIVTFVAGDKSEMKPGAKIIIFGAVKKEDGTLEASRVNVGRCEVQSFTSRRPAFCFDAFSSRTGVRFARKRSESIACRQAHTASTFSSISAIVFTPHKPMVV